jgi:hypothetical protein
VTFAEIQTAVANWLNRDDLSSVIPTFIQFAQKQIERENNLRYMKSLVQLEAVGSYLQLPDRYKETDGLWVMPKTEGKLYLLEKMEERAAWQYYPYRSSILMTTEAGVPIIQEGSGGITLEGYEPLFPGRPRLYSTVANGTYFLLRPEPDSTDYVYQLSYYGYSTDLSAATDTNWLSIHAPDALIYGALLIASPYLVEEQRAPMWLDAYRMVMSSIAMAERQEIYAGSRARTRTPMPVI